MVVQLAFGYILWETNNIAHSMIYTKQDFWLFHPLEKYCIVKVIRVCTQKKLSSSSIYNSWISRCWSYYSYFETIILNSSNCLVSWGGTCRNYTKCKVTIHSFLILSLATHTGFSLSEFCYPYFMYPYSWVPAVVRHIITKNDATQVLHGNWKRN